MKILIRQFLGQLHSWSVIGWGIADALIADGRDVHLFSTDGIAHLPSHLKTNLIGYTEENDPKVIGRLPDQTYDSQISYTALKNFPHLLGNGNQKRIGTWCYEWVAGEPKQRENVLPIGFAKNYKYCDRLCAPTSFVKNDMFIPAGIPEEIIKVVPHGINVDNFKQASIIKLPTKKSFKILANLAQTHLRKNIPALLEAYGQAFSSSDDICLLIRSKNKPVKHPFEISLSDCLQAFYKKYPKHAEVRILSEYIEDISSLYRSIDATYTMSHSEGFYLPAIEALASGKVSIAPRWGGQLDFLNDDNALLIDGEEVRANPKAMYWETKQNAVWFEPSIEYAKVKLIEAFNTYKIRNAQLELQRNDIYEKYSWKNIVKEMYDGL